MEWASFYVKTKNASKLFGPLAKGGACVCAPGQDYNQKYWISEQSGHVSKNYFRIPPWKWDYVVIDINGAVGFIDSSGAKNVIDKILHFITFEEQDELAIVLATAMTACEIPH